MILWSSTRLEQALASGQLDSWTKVKYLIVPAIVGSFAVPFYVFHPVYGQKAPALNALFSLIFGIVTAYLYYWGIKRCFIANSSIDGEAFFERLIVLGVPVLLRIIAVVAPLTIVLLIILGNIKDRFPMVWYRAGILFSAFAPITTFATYVMLTNSIRRFGRFVLAATDTRPNLRPSGGT